MDDALHDMVRRIKAGGEFPDAAYASATKFGVKQETLEAMYNPTESEACRECGEQYNLNGDGYDGMCPDCADVAEEEDEVYDATCPKCGGHNFRMHVMQRIHVQFGATGDHDVYDGPDGDIEFDDDTGATCTGCLHYAPLGKMKASNGEEIL